MTSTDDIVSNQSPITPSGARYLPQQTINDSLIDIKFEVRRSGIYKRKSLLAPEGVEAEIPSINTDPPQERMKDLQRLSHFPAYIFRIGERIDDKRQLIAIKFCLSPQMGKRAAEWKTIWVTYDQIADQKKLLELAKEGLPVTSNTAKDLVTFFVHTFAENAALRDPTIVARRVGFHEIGDKKGWLLGSRWVGDGIDVSNDPSMKHRLLSSIGVVGDFEKWKSFCTRNWSYDGQSWIIRWLLACSFASPILRHVKERSFFVHQYGRSHGGKTLTTCIGQSAWGHPFDFMESLNNSTATALGEMFRYISDLPLALDETEGSDVIDMHQFIYRAAGGKSRSRAKKDGMIQEDSTQPWWLIIRTTGERPIVGGGKADLGGATNRVVEVRHPGLSPDHALKVYQELKSLNSYGHAGLLFTHKLYELLNDIPTFARFEQRLKDFHKLLVDTSKPKEKRALERQLATIALAEMLMLKWVFDFSDADAASIAIRDAVEILTKWIRIGNGSFTLWERAQEFLLEHRTAFANLYVDGSSEDGRRKLAKFGANTSAGIVGIYNVGKDGEEVWYFPEQVNYLLRQKFNSAPDRIWEDFAEKQILIKGTDRLVRRRTVDAEIMPAQSVYVVNGKALAQLTEEVSPPVTDLARYGMESEWEGELDWEIGPEDDTSFD